jgi:ribosomal protein S27AE
LDIGAVMRLEEALNQVGHKFASEHKRRYACSHCGKTWVELVGLFSGNIEGQEDIYFRIGEETETCQHCRFNSKTCPACGSKDAYEINFPTNLQESPLSFNQIRIVSKT